MPLPRVRPRGRRRILKEPRTELEEVMQRDRAFAAIRRLYCESVPLWRVCERGPCRRNKRCCGDPEACLERGWKLFSAAERDRAWAAVQHGGPRRVAPATASEKGLRHYPASNFTHR
jgi:hypothetical protein